MTYATMLAVAAGSCAALSLGAWLFLHSERFGALPAGDELDALRRSPNWSEEHGGFRNPIPTPRMADDAGFLRTLAEYVLTPRPYAAPEKPLPTQKPDLRALPIDKDCVIWLGHSSFFLQLGGRRILIDPVLSGSGGPVSLSTRAFPGSDVLTPGDLPDIDILLLSHDHWDHLDHETLKALRPRIASVVCGLGNGAHLRRWGFEPSRIHEGDWGQAFRFGPLTVRLTEARHYSGRGFTTHKALWCGFILETSGEISGENAGETRRLFFSGDSGYGPHFARIGREHGPFDLALLECGQYDRRWPFIHMKPEETAQAAEDLRARALLPAHNGKFCIAYHGWREPLERVSAASAGRPYRLVTPHIGEQATPWDGLAPSLRWWE